MPVFKTALSYWTSFFSGCKIKTILFTHENSFKLKRAFFCFYLLLQRKWGRSSGVLE